MKWQPIKTAPRDYTRILVLLPPQYAFREQIVRFDRRVRPRWVSDHGDTVDMPTHWMPLFKPESEEGS